VLFSLYIQYKVFSLENIYTIYKVTNLFKSLTESKKVISKS